MSITVVLTLMLKRGEWKANFVMEESGLRDFKKVFYYYAVFVYDKKEYVIRLSNPTDLRREAPLCIINVVEPIAATYLRNKNLLVDGRFIGNVRLFDEDGEFIVCTSDLSYK